MPVATHASARLIAITLAAATLSGCVSYNSATDHVTAPIPDVSFLSEITLGETTTAWLRESFGNPSAVRRPDDQTAIWQYENVQRTSRRIRALPLLAIETSDMQRTVYNFEIENDYVVRYWKDSPQ